MTTFCPGPKDYDRDLHGCDASLAEGRSNVAIARRRVISEKAVVQPVSHMHDKLELALPEDDHRRVLAVARYLVR